MLYIAQWNRASDVLRHEHATPKKKQTANNILSARDDRAFDVDKIYIKIFDIRTFTTRTAAQSSAERSAANMNVSILRRRPTCRLPVRISD